MADFFIDLINLIIKGLASVISSLINLFPQSPFSEPSHPPDSINLSWVTWLIPFPTMIVHFSFILTAFASYYFFRIVARWLKIVRS